MLKYCFDDRYTFTAQRCSVGTTLLDSTFSPALGCLATPQAVSPVQASTPSPTAEVSPVREHLCSFTQFQFATQEVRHAHSPAKNALFPLCSKSTFLSVSLRITHLGRFAYSLSMYLSISLSTIGIVMVFSFKAFKPRAIKSPIRTKFNTTSMAATIEYAPVRYR